MGFLKLFNKKSAVIYDDFFGYLEPVKLADDSKKIMKGKAWFAPTGGVTDYFIICDNDRPSEWQRQFYSDLQTSFKTYAEKMQMLIESGFSQRPDHFIIYDFCREFQIVSITIPLSDLPSPLWNITLVRRAMMHQQIRVEFNGENPSGIFIHDTRDEQLNDSEIIKNIY